MAFSMSKQPKMACLLLLMVLLMAVDAQDPQVAMHNIRARSLLQYPPKIDCPGTCKGRCVNNWMNQMCNELCVKCCNKCNCVPPGTGQDTRHLCACYDTMVNPHTGKLKCP